MRAERPPSIRFDDLAHPRFTDTARSILDMMAEAGASVTLEPAPLMESAVDGHRPEGLRTT